MMCVQNFMVDFVSKNVTQRPPAKGRQSPWNLVKSPWNMVKMVRINRVYKTRYIRPNYFIPHSKLGKPTRSRTLKV